MEAGAGVCSARVDNARAEAHIYLQGATVTHFQPRGPCPALFLSNRATWAAGRAIRGGVPLIFPWFGAHAEQRQGADARLRPDPRLAARG